MIRDRSNECSLMLNRVPAKGRTSAMEGSLALAEVVPARGKGAAGEGTLLVLPRRRNRAQAQVALSMMNGRKLAGVATEGETGG